MLHECRATHVFWVIWDAEFDGDIHFWIWPKKRSMSGQTRTKRSHFQIQNLLTKPCLYCLVLCQDSKNLILFHVWQSEMPELAFQKVTSSPYLFFFWPLYSKKIKILLWIFLSGLCVCMLITHILFLWISWKIWIMCATIYEKWNFEFWGTKSEISQTWYVLYVELAMFGVFRLRFISELKILAAFQHLPFFLPKMAKHDVTKTQFSQKFLDRIFWAFGGRRQIDAGEGTKSFASISAAGF